MSFLARSSILRAARPAAAFTYAPRAFSTSIIYRKSATETAKDTLKTVDRAVADKLVDGIEAGQNAAAKAKEAAGMSTGEVKGKAAELTGEAKGKASELSGKANELAGEAKGKASELAGEAKGQKEEIKGKL